MLAYLRAIEMDQGAALVKTSGRVHNFGTLLAASRKKRRDQATQPLQHSESIDLR